MEYLTSIVPIVISIMSLAFSIYIHFENKKNKDQIDKQRIKLYELTIDKERERLEIKQKARLNVVTKTIQRNQHQIIIKNNGETTAKNVRLRIHVRADLERRLFREMYSVFPATIHSGNEITFKYKTMQVSHLKVFKADLMWDDEFQRENKETIIISQ